MLKTVKHGEVRLITQPDHARVSAYLAAHWGGANGFARAGGYEPALPDPGSVRDAVLLATAEHDNGWLEWEAWPPFDERDGLPVRLRDLGAESPVVGIDRWRRGVARYREDHPYGALLIAMHPYWLYAFAFGDSGVHRDEAFRHPLFAPGGDAAALVRDRPVMRAFLGELEAARRELAARLAAEAAWRPALAPSHLNPHVRLVQMADAMSLLLCFDEPGERTLPGAPRAGWGDRVPLTWTTDGDGAVVCRPYPFDLDPLPVHVPMRVVRADPAGAEPDTRLAALHGAPIVTRRFEVRSAR